MRKEESSKEKVSQVFSTARIYALLSIVSAHIYFPNTFAGQVFNRFGTLGVIVFLMISGYYFRTEKFVDWKNLAVKKAHSILVPWLVCGTLTWLYNAILSPLNRSFLGWLNWLLGNGSYLYYLTILLLCLALLFKAGKLIICLTLPLTVASILLTSFGVFEPILAFLHINNYLNLFNWIGFFGAGMLLQKISEETIFSFLKKGRIWFLAIFSLLFSILLFFPNIKTDYFSFLAIPFEILGGLAILGLSTWRLTGCKFFQLLAGASFPIYLLHIVFIGLFDQLLNQFIITRIFSPVIIIMFVFGIIMLFKVLSKILKMEKVFSLVTGMRNLK